MAGRQEKLKPEDRVKHWGSKYRKRKFKNIPTDYLKWFYYNAYDQMVARRRWVREELERRGEIIIN